jgi:hypothetical protein
MKPVTLSISVTAYFDGDEIPAIYSNEDMFAEAIKEHVTYALDRLDAQDIVFNSIDLEGLS